MLRDMLGVVADDAGNSVVVKVMLIYMLVLKPGPVHQNMMKNQTQLIIMNQFY